jgi:hypothetical protein
MEEHNVDSVGDLERFGRSFERHLRAENKPPRLSRRTASRSSVGDTSAIPGGTPGRAEQIVQTIHQITGYGCGFGSSMSPCRPIALTIPV